MHAGPLNFVRGVFKKRPNFLNRAPTSIEGALRLLSAPDGKQTVLPGEGALRLLSAPDGKQTVLPGSFSAFEGCCAKEEA